MDKNQNPAPDEILQVPDERLRTVCAAIDFNTIAPGTLQQNIKRLQTTLSSVTGIGIAGPQIGLMQRITLIQIPAKNWLVFGPVEPVPMHALINPSIQWSSKETIKAVETCLSIEGYMGFVERPQRIVVTASTPEGKPLEIEADGLYARCLQHEIDHLDGILYPDHVTTTRDLFKIQRVEAGDPLLSHNRLIEFPAPPGG